VNTNTPGFEDKPPGRWVFLHSAGTCRVFLHSAGWHLPGAAFLHSAGTCRAAPSGRSLPTFGWHLPGPSYIRPAPAGADLSGSIFRAAPVGQVDEGQWLLAGDDERRAGQDQAGEKQGCDPRVRGSEQMVGGSVIEPE